MHEVYVCVEWTVIVLGSTLCVVQDGVWSGQCALCVVQDRVCGVDSVPCVLYRTVCVEWTVCPVCCTGQCVWSGQ